MKYLKYFYIGALAVGLLHSGTGFAETDSWEDWNAKFQVTYVAQRKAGFDARYSGQNSLSTSRERSYSFTTTAAFGYRPWGGGELYFNPELSQGVPLSNLTGLGGFSNGEIARVTGRTPKLYRAKLFLRQTWGLGGGQEAVESDMNQLAGNVDKRRVVVTAGNLSVLDIFDDNSFSHDARTQFLNWGLVTHGAFDYAADARGYSWGIATEYYRDDWTVRAGRFVQPREPNQLSLDPRILQHYGDQIEFEHRHELRAQPGAVRVLFFRNRARMSRFDDALSLAATAGGVPDINLVRDSEHIKYGVGLNVEQRLSSDVGVFARASWADGQTETYAFTEIDNSITAGAVIKGTSWGRAQDTVGLAILQNGLSRARQNYLAAGGMGFFIGDGALRYRPENILEAYYNWNLAKKSWATLDVQRVVNPAYNADRGPVSIASVRLHFEF